MSLPPDMVAVEVHAQIAYFRKAFPLTARGAGPPAAVANASAGPGPGPGPGPPPQVPSVGPALPPHHKNYNQANLCMLDGLPHSALYCELIREFRRPRAERRLRVLWVGSPCGSPRAAQVAAFLASAGPHGDGSAVDMVALNLAPTSASATPATCAPAKDATPTFSSVLSGNDALASAAAVAASGYDLIIEDNAPKRASSQRKQTFDHLWPKALNYGGLYVLESVDDPNDTQMLTDVLGWGRYNNPSPPPILPTPLF